MVRRLLAAVLFAASMAFVFAAAASAAPDCPKNTVTINNQGKVITVPAQSQVCDDDPFTNDGLLGNLPVVGNLPGVGGIL
jgi:opacity protein-like surface antigen